MNYTFALRVILSASAGLSTSVILSDEVAAATEESKDPYKSLCENLCRRYAARILLTHLTQGLHPGLTPMPPLRGSHFIFFRFKPHR